MPSGVVPEARQAVLEHSEPDSRLHPRTLAVKRSYRTQTRLLWAAFREVELVHPLPRAMEQEQERWAVEAKERRFRLVHAVGEVRLQEETLVVVEEGQIERRSPSVARHLISVLEVLVMVLVLVGSDGVRHKEPQRLLLLQEPGQLYKGLLQVLDEVSVPK